MIANSEKKSTLVPVIRGSNSPILSQKLHWIEGTFKSRETVNVPSILSQKWIETKPRNGYLSASLYEDGRTLMQHPGRPEMGTHLTWTGTACDNCPMDCIELVAYLEKANFTFTRLDMAIDAINFNLRPQQATKELEHGRCKTKAKLSPRRDDPRQLGYTQSVGYMSSEMHLKLYDKAAELGVGGDHTRIELTVKSRRANKAAREIVRGTDFRALVVAYADFPSWREWRQIMVADPVKLPSERKETNTERWLLDQCAPSIARIMFLNDSTEFYEKFKSEVMQQLIQLSNDRQTVH